MRDAQDTVTMLIPGVEPLPPEPPKRPTIAVRMGECSYSAPMDRDDTCRHCRHRHDQLQNVGSWAESATYRCKLHDFPIQLGAVCNDHERAKVKS
jgi:hypothetical protein